MFQRTQWLIFMGLAFDLAANAQRKGKGKVRDAPFCKKSAKLGGMHWPPHATKMVPTEERMSSVPESVSYASSRRGLEHYGIRNARGLEVDKLFWTRVVASRILPSYSKTGYRVQQMPEVLFNKFRKFYEPTMRADFASALATLPVEWVNRSMPLSSQSDRDEQTKKQQVSRKKRPLLLQPNIAMIGDEDDASELDPSIQEIKPLVEEWAGGQEFEGPTDWYGVRVYQNGSLVVPHVDFWTQGMVAVTMLIGEDLDEPWPLEIESALDGSIRQVVLKPGQMLFYEGAKLFHGRVTPMRGRHYGIVTAMYRPTNPVFDFKYGEIVEAAVSDFKPGEYDCLKDEVEDVENTCPASSLSDSCGSVKPYSSPWEDYLAHYWNKRGVGQYELPFQPGPSSLHMHMSEVKKLAHRDKYDRLL